MKFLSDLDSVEVLKQVSSKLPSYSQVKWCRHAFDMKKNCRQVVTFHDLVTFVATSLDVIYKHWRHGGISKPLGKQVLGSLVATTGAES